MRKILTCSLAAFWFFLASLMLATNVFAQKSQEGVGKWLKQIGVFGGFLQGDLKGQDDLQVIPLGMRFGFDLEPFAEKFGFETSGMLELIYEPFIGSIISPQNNVELGVAFLFRYSFPLTQKLYPFVEVGSGLYYMTVQTQEQGTQFNFVDQGGAGFSYFLKKDFAVNIEYRFRHVSNCSIKDPNGGIDSEVYLIGFSYYY